MTKYYGKVGFMTTEKTSPGVWTEKFEERYYAGDVIKNSYRFDNGSGLNKDLNINNSISIVSDEYFYDNVAAVAYIEWLGSLWRVTNVEIQRPRLILSIGGVFNKDEEQIGITDSSGDDSGV